MLRALECDFATTKLSWFIFATKMHLCPMTLWFPSPPRVFADSRETIIFHRRADRCCCIFKAPRLALLSSFSPLTLHRPM